MNERRITLSGIGYRMTEIDGQLIFEEMGGICGVTNRFTLEWKGCGWYLVDFEHSFGRVRLSHLNAAAKWVEENFTIEYHNGVGTVTLNDKDVARARKGNDE